jgi:predicted Zn-dependent peptidase
MTVAPALAPPTLATLPNGVSLLNAPTGSTNAGVFLIVRAGSRDESPKTAGLAHFLEHMFFKGTANRPTSIQISREFDSLGALSNAYTDIEEVAYYTEGPATATHQLADIITDMLSHPLFEPDEVERERNVVLQELASRLLQPEGWVGDRMYSVAFGGDQPMSWSAAGFPPVVEAVSAEELVAYHRSFYSPESMALVVSGGAVTGEDEAAEMLKDIPKGACKPRRPAVWGQGAMYAANVRPVSADEEEQIVMAFAMPGIPALDPDRVTLQVMQHALGGGMSSRLFHTVREREGLCYYIGADHEAYEDAGMFQIYTATRPKDAVRTTRLSFQELRGMAAEPLPAHELATCKESMVGNLLRGTETARGSAAWHARRWRTGLPLRTPLDVAAGIRAVTAEDVLRVAQRIAAGIAGTRLAFVAPADLGTDLLEAVNA